MSEVDENVPPKAAPSVPIVPGSNVAMQEDEMPWPDKENFVPLTTSDQCEVTNTAPNEDEMTRLASDSLIVNQGSLPGSPTKSDTILSPPNKRNQEQPAEDDAPEKMYDDTFERETGGTTENVDAEMADASTHSNVAPQAESIDEEYYIKWIAFPPFSNSKAPVIMQNMNGPCPALALMNVLMLQQRIVLPPEQQIITADEIRSHITTILLSTMKGGDIEDSNYQQNLNDALEIIPTVLTGVDVNVKFSASDDFEFTPVISLFDVLGVKLFHGWVVEAENWEESHSIGGRSYNELAEFIATHNASDGQQSQRAFIASAFLERTASQLTYAGLVDLMSKIVEEQLIVLFRNNHFLTVFKIQDALYSLVTDQGFLTESEIVWESLDSIDGDVQYLPSHFNLKSANDENDTALARALQEEEDFAAAAVVTSATDVQTDWNVNQSNSNKSALPYSKSADTALAAEGGDGTHPAPAASQPANPRNRTNSCQIL